MRSAGPTKGFASNSRKRCRPRQGTITPSTRKINQTSQGIGRSDHVTRRGATSGDHGAAPNRRDESPAQIREHLYNAIREVNVVVDRVKVKLTSMAKAAGCAAKLNPATLDGILRKLPRQSDPNVLVGFDTNDDAGIYRLSEDLALVQTVDFFTPIVDDPFTFGQIAAANALSDVYAMGGTPISALSLVGFPEKGDPAILEQIIRGGLNKMDEAKCSVIGGHSIRNEDILFGCAVTGKIDPRRIWRNVGARPGDVLLFTKSI